MYKTDLEIATEAKMIHIKDVAEKIGLTENDIEYYGKYKAKLNLDILEKNKNKKDAKVVLVTAINPTPAGEGKSTTTIGLGQALCKLNKNAIIALREPSLGPVFGVKGGAAGGGYSQVVPMEDINLHFTGDIHAITTANNLISAILDNSLMRDNSCNINPKKVIWKRALDMNDRALREIVVGLGKSNGNVREDRFQISVASEIMAVLCLAKNFDDLKFRLGKIIVAYSYDNKPVTVENLGCTGAIAMVLKDAIKPNLVQTLENTPVIIHGGPFANIAHGCNSVIATKMATKMADIVVTEAGFGADLGAEKFLDIKARYGEINPNAVVIVATIRALKMNGGVEKKDLGTENVEALSRGIVNLEKHIETIQTFGLPYVIAINKFVTDSQQELKFLHNWSIENNHPVAMSEVWEHGGVGGMELAEKVLEAIEKENKFKPIYDLEDSIKDKIKKIATKVYGASDVVYTKKALNDIKACEQNGLDKLCVCIAKNQYSLSDDPKLLGRPKDFTITVREITPSSGAGFLVVLTGDVMTMPGLPKVPAAMNMDIDSDGNISGLF